MSNGAFVQARPYVPARIVQDAQDTFYGFVTLAESSVSTYCAIQVTHYRNCEGVQDPDWVERIGRRVVGELCYYGLIVASLVEAAVRLTLSLLTGLIGLPLVYACGTRGDFLAYLHDYLNICLIGALLNISNAASCAIALLRNPHEKTLRYENLFPPTSMVWDGLIHRGSAQASASEEPHPA